MRKITAGLCKQIWRDRHSTTFACCVCFINSAVSSQSSFPIMLPLTPQPKKSRWGSQPQPFESKLMENFEGKQLECQIPATAAGHDPNRGWKGCPGLTKGLKYVLYRQALFFSFCAIAVFLFWKLSADIHDRPVEPPYLLAPSPLEALVCRIKEREKSGLWSRGSPQRALFTCQILPGTAKSTGTDLGHSFRWDQLTDWSA